ncbi:hypothetical protein [Fusobacterium sp. PH5-44]|uniref:hypothetical protein n=1 Tax=unclassified Fusobacterium TaxID=2648384 RepID=UPI003D1AD76A
MESFFQMLTIVGYITFFYIALKTLIKLTNGFIDDSSTLSGKLIRIIFLLIVLAIILIFLFKKFPSV